MTLRKTSMSDAVRGKDIIISCLISIYVFITQND